jgi:uncharacterized protein YbbC (DUF1343 family)
MACTSQSNDGQQATQGPKKSEFRILSDADVMTGAEQLDKILDQLNDKKVAVVVNQTSMVGDRHLVDELLTNHVDVTKIFAPEHGFRGEADAGKHVADDVDAKTKLPIKSLYGQSKKPSPEDLLSIDVVIFDIQDVGARFYTYLSTLSYIMEACAENSTKLIILDRPNPNGFYVDGPILDTAFKSFVGLHPIPVVHGMTFGELAWMIHDEKWASCEGLSYEIVSCINYDHDCTYILPVQPSPNLPNHQSIMLYPSICFFEPTNFSIGRGTDAQFQLIGRPEASEGDFYFTPEPKPGAMSPKHLGVLCRGVDLRSYDLNKIYAKRQLDLSFLVDYLSGDNIQQITSQKFFDKLAGSSQLRTLLKSGKSADQIRESWEPRLSEFRELRAKYLLY